MRYLYILLGLSLLAPALVLAQDANSLPRAEVREKVQEIRGENQVEIKTRILEKREEAKQEAVEKREEVKAQVLDDKKVFREKIETKGDNMGEIFMERKENLKQNILDNRIESRETIKRNMEEAQDIRKGSRETLKNELRAKVSDENKIKAVERFSVQIDEINDRMVGVFNKSVDSLGEFMARMQIRADKAVLNGLDTFAFDTVLDSAQEAILSARSAIEVQSGVVYEIDINNEETLREDVLGSKEEFRSDLKVVRDSIDLAKTAVRNALLALKSVPEVDSAEVK